MTFLVTNLACFLLKISSAPNFRPSFRYFNSSTAAFGFLISGASMFFVDGLYVSPNDTFVEIALRRYFNVSHAGQCLTTCLGCRLCGNSNHYLLNYPLHLSSEIMGRCESESNLSPSTQVPTTVTAIFSTILAAPDIIVRQRSSQTV